MKKLILVTAALVLLAIGLAVQATAKTITLGSDFEFSGATAPVGTTPWLTTTFDDGGGTGSVTITLAATSLTDNECVSVWYLNFDPESQVNSLSFSERTRIGDFEAPSITLITNGFKADGDGQYDIRLGFATNDGLATRFTAGDSVSYTVTGIVGMTADSFNVLSQSGGGYGPFLHAEHVQSIGPLSGSGWVTGSNVPEPSSIIALLGGLGSLLAIRRRRA